MSDFVALWPVTFLKKKADNAEQLNRQLIGIFGEYRQAHPRPGAGYISPDDFARDLPHPAIDALKTFITDSVYEISLKLNRQYWENAKLQSLDVDLTGLWFQITNDYMFHETHVHGNCSWSGVYYVQSGNASKHAQDTLDNGMLNGVTRFFGPEMEYSAGGHGDWGNYYLHHNTFTSYPEDGTLLIFPSHIKHTALPYAGEQDRIIVSFHAQVNSKTAVKYDYGFS